MKILALHAGNKACARYRIINPMAHLAERGHEVRCEEMFPMQEMCSSWFGPYDVLLLERFSDPGIIDLCDAIKTQWTPEGILSRPKIVYELDDICWRLTPDRPHYNEFDSAHKQRIKETIRRSDAVIASTPELADEVRQFNPNVYVCPNAIDYKLRDWEPNEPRHNLLRGRCVIGWAGGDRPVTDWSGVGWAVSQVLKENPEAILAIAGSRSTCEETLRYLNVPNGRAVLLPPVDFDQYPALLSNFDIGLAPLADTPFNRCKSELKLLEYGALGIPYVASPVAPYKRFHELSRYGCGSICTSAKEWYRAIKRLVSEQELREIMGTEARRFVRANYSQEVIADQWEKALLEVCNGSEIHKARSQEKSLHLVWAGVP